jgi:hypothetical protein
VFSTLRDNENEKMSQWMNEWMNDSINQSINQNNKKRIIRKRRDSFPNELCYIQPRLFCHLQWRMWSSPTLPINTCPFQFAATDAPLISSPSVRWTSTKFNSFGF